MAKAISYSDFLKEGALQLQEHPSVVQMQTEVKPFRIIPEDIVSGETEKEFWKKLRYFFRTGEGNDPIKTVLVPALIAPYLRHGNWETEYPFYLAGEKSTSQSLEKLLEYSMNIAFKADEAKVLKLNLPRLQKHFKDVLNKGYCKFEEAVDKALEELLKLDVHDEDGVRFRADVESLRSVLPTEGYLLGFHPDIPLLLIRQKLEQIEWNRNEYKKKIKKRIDALRDLLHLNEEKFGKAEPNKGFEFASNMIALDKVQDMLPGLGTGAMSDDRVKRIEELITILNTTLEQHENHAHIVVNEDLKQEYPWELIYTSSKLSFLELKQAFHKAEQLFDQNIKAFTGVLVAMRKAELELEGKYEVQVHDDYFNHFKWFKLDQEELTLFPPVVLVVRSNDLLTEGMHLFSNLVLSNKLVKIIALTTRTVNPTNPNIDWEDASLSFRQELAANALSHRNIHTLQCASDRPLALLQGIRSSLESASPSLMHLLLPSLKDDLNIAFLKINAAAAGRYFPYIMYNPSHGKEWGARFNVLDNSQAESDWPVYPFEHETADGRMLTELFAFTYADYKAMNREKVQELFIVPESMVTDYLIPLADYLKLSQNEQTGLVPFIWLVDEDNYMKRAAVPYMWVASCLERLDFWNFVQELGGLNNYHVKTSLATFKQKCDEQKSKEIAQMAEKHKQELAKAQRESAGIAMDKLASVLLNLDTLSFGSGTASKATKPAVQELKEQPTEAGAAVKIEIEQSEDKPEAYVETFRCTSCNDCTDKYPAIFSYNEEKQAFVKDASKGSFEQLVMAAESCPASCIHPGEPLNPNEPNLNELIARAAKFN